MRRWSKATIGTAVTVVAALLMGGVAWPAAEVYPDDVAIVDSDDVTVGTGNRVPLERSGPGVALTVNVTAEAGNVKPDSGACDSTKLRVETKRDWLVTATGLIAKPDSLTYTNATVSDVFACQKYSESSDTVALAINVFADTGAPLGHGSRSVTFSALNGAGLVRHGSEVQLKGTWTDPTLAIAVLPRPASNLVASKDTESPTDTINVTWTRSPDHDEISSYIVTRDTDTVSVQPSGDEGTTQTFVDSGLTADTEYCYTVTARYTDNDGNHFDSSVVPGAEEDPVCATTDPAGGSTITYSASFKHPLDMSGVLNKAKLGRVVPVKVEVLGDDDPQTEDRSSVVYFGSRKADCTSDTADSVEQYLAAGSSNSGNVFRWDTTGDFWIYNLDTGKLPLATVGSCYQVDVYRDGTVDPGTAIASGGVLVGSVKIQLTK